MRCSLPHRTLALARSSALLLLLAFAVGCGSADTTGADSAPFIGTYIDPTGPAGTITLDVRAGGTFTLSMCDLGLEVPGEREQEITGGSWTLLAEGLELDTGEWRATLVSDSVPVAILGHDDTLPGLRWVSESESAPLRSARFVRLEEFQEFVHPPGGFGGEGM